MNEVFPVLAGIGLGLVFCRVRPGMLRTCLLAASGFILGATASWLGGELIVSAWYVLLDSAQVLVAASLTGLLANAWLRRRRVAG